MAVPFGFSVGDFIAVGKLIAQIVDELRENGEVTSSYQSVLIELEALQRALSQLQTLKPARHELLQLNSIRATVCACQKPLQGFLNNISKFERRLGVFNASQQKWKGLPRRMQFRIMLKNDIKELRSFLTSHVATINILLMTQAVSSISSAEVDRHDLMSGLERKILVHRRLIEDIGVNVELHLQADLHTQAQLSKQTSALDHIGNKADVTHEQLRNHTDAIHAVRSTTELTQTQTTSILGATTQILDLLTSGPVYIQQLSGQLNRMLQICCNFTTEMREAMAKIMQLFSSIHLTLQRIERELPTRTYPPIVQLTTALGEVMALPYQMCQQWTDFAEVMKAICLNKPGRNQVIDGTYWIWNTRGGNFLQEISWQHAVLQDDHLLMFIIVDEPGTKSRSSSK